MAGAAETITLPSGYWLDGRHERQLCLHPVPAMDESLALEADSRLAPAARVTALLARHVVGNAAAAAVDALTVARSLSVGDREAVLLHLRRERFGNDLDCLVDCPTPNCGEPVSVELRVSELLLPPYENPRPSYELGAEHAGIAYRIRFRLPIGADLEAAALASQADPTAGTRLLVRNCVLAIQPRPADNAADALTSALEADLSQAVLAHDPQAELQLDLECPSCGNRFSTFFDTGAFLIDELERESAVEQAEVESLAFYYHWPEREILAMSRARRRSYLDLLAQRLGAEADV
jgi:hypothetical protein